MANLKLGSTAAVDKNGFIQNYPVGTIVIRVNSTIDDGWLLCDGSYANIADYPELYAHLGTTYGPITATFKLPPLVYNATNNPQNRIPFSTLLYEAAYPSNFFHTHTLGINATNFASFDTPGHSHTTNSSTSVTQSVAHTHNASTGTISTTSSAGASESSRAGGPNGPYASGPSGGTGHTHATGTAWTTTPTVSLSHAHTVNFHNSTNLNHAHNHTTNVASVTNNISPVDSATLPSAQYPPSMEVYFLIKT